MFLEKQLAVATIIFSKQKYDLPGKRIQEKRIKKEQYEQLEQRRYNLRNLGQERSRTLYKVRLDQKLEDRKFDSTEEHYNHIREYIHITPLQSA